MHLRETGSNCIHISHFHHFVSAYETNEETVADLEEAIREAVVCAKAIGEGVIVDQDCGDHVFIVHPRGSISLMAERKSFEILPEEEPVGVAQQTSRSSVKCRIREELIGAFAALTRRVMLAGNTFRAGDVSGTIVQIDAVDTTLARLRGELRKVEE